MLDISNIINDTVSISLFNKGLAGKIFEEVKQSGIKVVLKNNVAECILISPSEYLKLLEEVNDARLVKLADERIQHADLSRLVSGEDLFSELGITDESLEIIGEVDFE